MKNVLENHRHRLIGHVFRSLRRTGKHMRAAEGYGHGTIQTLQFEPALWRNVSTVIRQHVNVVILYI